jgi:tRNA dimethylallyltransferase
MSGPVLLVVVGPTASGKTEFAVRLCEALGGEIVTADSVQVYRHFNCGTGKPTEDERRRAAHHLVDILDPLETLDAADWAKRAEATIAEIRQRGRIPIVCGGSFLWVRALTLGLAQAPGASPEVRQRHKALVDAKGRAALHSQLAERDPVIAARLNPNDTVRVSRALEVLELTGTTMSEWQAEHGFRTKKNEHQLVGVHRDGPELDARIAARTERMLGAGWFDEVRALREQGFAEARAMHSVGYRQVSDALDGGTLDRDQLHAAIVRATRIFARRQRTWLRDAPVTWIHTEDFGRFLGEVMVRRRELLP